MLQTMTMEMKFQPHTLKNEIVHTCIDYSFRHSTTPDILHTESQYYCKKRHFIGKIKDI